MFKKAMKPLTNNMGLKLLSILFSIVLWLVVVNIADPEGTKTFSIPVTIKNKEVIEQMGKVPDIVSDSDIAVFYITGPRSYVEDMNADDFTVSADLSQMDLSQEDEKKLVRIEIVPKKYEKYITVHQKTVNLQVTLEELAEKNFVISPITSGTPAEGCAIGTVEVTPNLLTVSGPDTIVSKISKVTATINVNGISSDVTDSVKPVLFDEEGNVINSELLEMNQVMVNITANILATRSLSLQCGVTGNPAEGYEYKGLEYAPQSINVKGEAEVLSTMTTIPIPNNVINIEGADSDVEEIIDINEYLPSGVSLVDEEANQVVVKAVILQKDSRIFKLPVKSINISGLPQNYELSYNVKTVPVTIRASKDHIEGFVTEDIQAAVNVEGLEPGIHTLPVEITINDAKYEVIGSVSVQIEITDKNQEEKPESDTNAEKDNEKDPDTENQPDTDGEKEGDTKGKKEDNQSGSTQDSNREE